MHKLINRLTDIQVIQTISKKPSAFTTQKIRAYLVALALFPIMAWAQATPTGLWKTIDDETGEAKSLVRITELAGTLTGKVEKSLVTDPNGNPLCTLCTDDRKGQTIVGMAIIRNVTKNKTTEGLWDGGEILDPQNGKTYQVMLTPAAGGTELQVRGYIGLPLLGRTQTWIRAE